MPALEFWHWLVLAVVLVTIEIFVPGAFFLGLGLGAFAAGAVLWARPELGWEGQVLAFALVSAGTIPLLRRFMRARPIHSEQPLLNQRARQYVGRTFRLDEPVEDGRGRIRVDDSTWRIAGVDCPAGTRVKVVDADGVVLMVEAVVE